MSKKQLRKSNDAIFDGVCGGIAEYFDIEPIWVRLLFVLCSAHLTMIYLVLMFIMPEAE